MKLSGNRPGYLFCHVNDKNMIDTCRKWSTHDFTEFLRQLLHLCGVGPALTVLYSAHSLKIVTVKLYRSLGIKDENIMEIIQSRGQTHMQITVLLKMIGLQGRRVAGT